MRVSSIGCAAAGATRGLGLRQQIKSLGERHVEEGGRHPDVGHAQLEVHVRRIAGHRHLARQRVEVSRVLRHQRERGGPRRGRLSGGTRALSDRPMRAARRPEPPRQTPRATAAAQHRLVAIALVCAPTLCVSAPPPASAALCGEEPLEILLTNDDGAGAAGIPPCLQAFALCKVVAH